MSMFWQCVLVTVTGGAGALVRYLLLLMMRNSVTGYSTFVINSIGCFLIGVFAGWLAGPSCSWSSDSRQIFNLACMTGFCGGFSTFSAFTLDCVKYIERGQFEIWLIFGAMTVFIGLFGCAFGYWLGKQI